MLRDLAAFLGTSFTCAAYIAGLGWLARRNALNQHLSRKIMHIGGKPKCSTDPTGNGLLYVLFWPTYSAQPAARLLCASVPALAAAHFALVGMGVAKDEALLKSATRSGSRQELLRGPFMYGAVISALTALYWRDSPVGVTAIAVLCAGDGFADIIGRRYGGSNKLLHSPDKSWAGSGACLLAGMLASMACVLLLQATDSRDGPLQALSMGKIAWGCGASAMVGAIIESLPIPEVDNITVPSAVVLAGHCAF